MKTSFSPGSVRPSRTAIPPPLPITPGVHPRVIPPAKPVPWPSVKPTVKPSEGRAAGRPRDSGGMFVPVVLSPAEAYEREILRDENRLVKFSDVLDVLAAFGGDAEESIVEALRERLLFQGHPIVRQKLAPYHRQSGVVQAIVGPDMKPSIQRRVGGAGWGSTANLEAAAKKKSGPIVLPA